MESNNELIVKLLREIHQAVCKKPVAETPKALTKRIHNAMEVGSVYTNFQLREKLKDDSTDLNRYNVALNKLVQSGRIARVSRANYRRNK